MNVAQRIQLIWIIEKIEKNPEFSNKLGVKNASGFISDKLGILNKKILRVQHNISYIVDKEDSARYTWP